MKIAFFSDFAGRNGEVNVRYRVELSEAERAELKGLVSGGKQAVRRLKRAQILLASDVGQTEEAIARALRIGISTVYRTRRRFVEGNLEGALSEEPRTGAARKLSGAAGRSHSALKPAAYFFLCRAFEGRLPSAFTICSRCTRTGCGRDSIDSASCTTRSLRPPGTVPVCTVPERS